MKMLNKKQFLILAKNLADNIVVIENPDFPNVDRKTMNYTAS